MGRVVKRVSRATGYDVINAELEVRGPELQTQLPSSELHELG